MDEAVLANSRVYTDIQGLKQLQYAASKNSPEAKKEVAHQFEAILMQLVLSSMRKANQAFSSGLFSNNQMEMYEDMFDKQLSLMMSNSSGGFAEMVEKSIDQKQGILPNQNEQGILINPKMVNQALVAKENQKQDQFSESIQPISTLDQPENKNPFHSQEDFVHKLWSSAKTAANLIGGNPEIILAQAALETNWGKNILPKNNNQTTHNLFNIKTGENWNKESVSFDTLEQTNGLVKKEKSNFRSYDSFLESFVDYTNVLKENNRYGQSLLKAAHPEEFINALQKAGYATDQAYAAKVMQIFKSPTFQNLIKNAKSMT